MCCAGLLLAEQEFRREPLGHSKKTKKAVKKAVKKAAKKKIQHFRSFPDFSRSFVDNRM